MAWLLRFPGGASGGSAGYITHPAVLSGASTFDVEIDFVPRVIGSSYTNVYSNNQPNNLQRHAMYMWGNSRAEIAFIIGGARKVLNAPLSTFTAGNRYKVNAVYDGSTLQMLVDDVPVASVAASGTVGGSGGLTQIGANGSEARAAIDLYRYKITENGVLVRDYDPSASGGVGTILPDVVDGANDGTQAATWPTYNGEWVSYSSGTTYTLTAQGGSYTYSGASADLAYTPAATVYTLTAHGGGYTYSGASADLTYTPVTVAYTLTAQGGSYTYAGASADLTYAASGTVYTLTAQGGSYAYSGASADLTYTAGPAVYRLTALGATYVYSGGAASLSASGVVPDANPNAFNITAQIAGPQNISAMVGGTLTNNAKIGGNMTISARLSQ